MEATTTTMVTTTSAAMMMSKGVNQNALQNISSHKWYPPRKSCFHKKKSLNNALSIISAMQKSDIDDDDSTVASTASFNEESCAGSKASTVFSIKVPAKKPSSVSFSRKVNVRLTLSYYNYTDEEVENTWYSQDEFDYMREICEHEIVILDGCDGDNKVLRMLGGCERGLEKHLPANVKTRSTKRKRMYKAVLGTQEIFRDEYTEISLRSDIDVIIARLYSQLTTSDQEYANMVGCWDEGAVIDQYEPEEEFDEEDEDNCEDDHSV